MSPSIGQRRGGSGAGSGMVHSERGVSGPEKPHERGCDEPPGPRCDVETRNRLVQENMGLVHEVARQFVNRGLSMEDLIGEGNLGLIRAAQTFDSSVGVRFGTYAFHLIREAIRTAVAQSSGTIRLPMNVCRLLGRWRKTERQLKNLRGHRPTFEEVAAAMGLDRPTQRLERFSGHCSVPTASA
jgi:RNA polymerase sigma factor (sigma-70 family)